MAVWGPKVINSWANWKEQGSTNSSVERVMDNAAYTSAHPDDTLVLAGPPRMTSSPGATDDDISLIKDCVPVGMLQNIAINQSKPFQPMMAIGSSRTFYLAGKAQGSAQIGRLFLNTDNLLRRVYSYAAGDSVAATVGKVDPSSFSKSGDNPAGDKSNTNYLINLDSEFFLIPFGLAVIFMTKAREAIGGFYMEMAVIPNYSVSVAAGQAMIMEGVSVLFDRLLPLGIPTAREVITKFESVIVPSDYK